jgi:hypothetical protein
VKFDLTRPCGNCPFRTDVRPYIRADKVRQVLGDPAATGAAHWPASSFACHKTVDYRRSDRGRVHARSQHCAGAAIILTGERLPNQAMQLAERLLGVDFRRLDLSALVYPSRAAAIEAHSQCH